MTPADNQPEFELEPGETVVREARKHWFLFALGMVPYALLALLPCIAPLVLLAAGPLVAPYARFFDYAEALPRALLGIWLLLVWTTAWNAFTRYYLNVWVLTDRRIVDITQRGYFNRQVSSVLLDRIQDVTTEVAGLLPSLIGIGNITVQSAGAVDEFHMNGIGEPEAMRELILEHVPRPASATPGV